MASNPKTEVATMLESLPEKVKRGLRSRILRR